MSLFHTLTKENKTQIAFDMQGGREKNGKRKQIDTCRHQTEGFVFQS